MHWLQSFSSIWTCFRNCSSMPPVIGFCSIDDKLLHSTWTSLWISKTRASSRFNIFRSLSSSNKTSKVTTVRCSLPIFFRVWRKSLASLSLTWITFLRATNDGQLWNKPRTYSVERTSKNCGTTTHCTLDVIYVSCNSPYPVVILFVFQMHGNMLRYFYFPLLTFLFLLLILSRFHYWLIPHER